MSRIDSKIERSYLYNGRLCRVCLDIFYEPPSQTYAPQHRIEDSDGNSNEWCTGSFQDWRPYSYGRVIQPGSVDTRQKPDTRPHSRRRNNNG